MKNSILTVLALTLLSITGCNNQSSPNAALENFFTAMSQKDITTARKYCTAESKSMLDMLEKQSLTDSTAIEPEKYKKENMTISDAVIEGDKATIAVTYKADGQKLNFYLKKENDVWKVAFDKETTLGMGLEQIKATEGEPFADTLTKSLDSIQKKSLDSVKADVKRQLKKLDSVRSILKSEH
mgnify:CR=1 FL=1